MTVALLLLLLASAGGNAFQAYLAKTNKKKPKPDLTAQDLLHDLTRRGNAILRIDVIDPANLMLRSPRS